MAQQQLEQLEQLEQLQRQSLQLSDTQLQVEQVQEGYQEEYEGGYEEAYQPEQVWVQHWDDEVEAFYYYNNQSGEATWVRPDDYVDGSEDGGDGTYLQEEEDTGNSAHVEYFYDDDAQMWYGVNAETGETWWEAAPESSGQSQSQDPENPTLFSAASTSSMTSAASAESHSAQVMAEPK